jgi:hypothetical protein
VNSKPTGGLQHLPRFLLLLLEFHLLGDDDCGGAEGTRSALTCDNGLVGKWRVLHCNSALAI